jgi:hypothetical protein
MFLFDLAREKKIKDYQVRDPEKFEKMCWRCGICCGAEDGDPCQNLVKLSSGKYFCRRYQNRLGKQLTVSGKSFNCVPIWKVLRYPGIRLKCAYQKILEEKEK